MKIEPIGMLGMIRAERPDHRPRAARWTDECPLKGRLMDGMRKFTLLGGPAGDISHSAAGGWAGEAGRRRKLFALHDPGGERRLLFGVGEGPAEAVAEAKENTDNNYPPSVAPPVLTSARTAALTGSGMFGQAAIISAGSGFISITPPI